MEGKGTKEGWVVRAQAGIYEVISDGQRYRCFLRSRLKKGKREWAQPVVVGDHVRFTPVGQAQGAIEEVLPRRTYWARARTNKPHQILVANLDQILLVFAAEEPPLERLLVDRFLAIAEALGLETLLCVNKCDLVPPEEVGKQMEVYRRLGYPLLFTSAVTGLGLEELQKALKDRISVLAGPSGVGKSSLLNAIQPGLRLRTGPLSILGRGRHITSEIQLLPLEMGGFVADTPGLQTAHLLDVAPQDLAQCFREIREYAAACRFADCSHLREPGCAVRAAVRRRRIDPLRYESYRLLRSELEAHSL